MRTTRLSPVLLALVLTLTACGGGGEGDGDDVASLGEGDVAAAEDTGDGDDPERGGGGGGGGGGGAGDEAEFQDAMLEFAECMREHGVDMPDPEFQDGGGVVVQRRAGDGDGPPSAAEEEEVRAAEEECQPILDEARSSRPAPSPEQQAEMQDELLAFAECMREHGIDFPDPEFTDDGGVNLSMRRGSGPDPDDPEFQDAQEECGGEGGFRMGAPPASASGDED